MGGSDGQSIHLDQERERERERESTSLEAYTFDTTHSHYLSPPLTFVCRLGSSRSKQPTNTLRVVMMPADTKLSAFGSTPSNSDSL